MKTLIQRVRRPFTKEGTLEMGAKAAYQMLDQKNKNLLVADFRRDDDSPMDDLLMVFARGERAAEARVALQSLLNQWA